MQAAGADKAVEAARGLSEAGEVTYTSSVQAGPTLIVTGYVASDLSEAYRDYNAAVAKAKYAVLKKEKEAHDAEIAYEGGDTTGQIALREECTEAETTYLRITSRAETPTLPSLTKLQKVATELVHETANSDAAGSRRILAELEDEFDKVKDVLETKTPAQEKVIDHGIEAVDAALKAKDSKKAYGVAKSILVAVNSAAAKLGGATQNITGLQVAAADLVREIEHEDAPGADRAYAELEKEFKKAQKLLIAKAPAQEKTIDHTLESVEEALDEGNFEEALAPAKTILKAVEAAAAKIAAGGPASTGLGEVVEQLKEAAGELDTEAKFKDKEGLERAFEEFHTIFKANQLKMRAKSAKAEDLIHDAMEAVELAIPSNNFVKIRAKTRALIAAVATGGKLLG